MNILIAGGSGGIGRALIKHCLASYPEANIHATYRTAIPKGVQPAERLTWWRIDFLSDEPLAQLAASIVSLDIIFCATGFLWSADRLPEKSLSQFDIDFFQQNIAANTVPTLMLAKHFSVHLKASKKSVLVALSARIGSISDNQMGGWISYRSSKAALNMAVKTIAIEWRRKLPNGCIVAFHPGTTETALSEPFQPNVKPEKLFSPDYVASCLLKLVEQLNAEQSGKFFAYDGSEIDW